MRNKGAVKRSRNKISHIIAMKKVNVSTCEHVTDGPLSSGPREALHFVKRGVRDHCGVEPSSFPSPLLILFLSIFLVLFLLALSSSLRPLSLSFSLSLTHPLYRFVLSRSLVRAASFASRSPVGHTPVRVKVSSVLPRILPPFPLFIKPPPSATTTFRDTSNDTSCPSSATAKFLDSVAYSSCRVSPRDDFFL